VIRLALRVRRADAELVLAELLELAPNGVEENEDGEVVEFAVYGAPGELPALPALRAAAGEAFVEVETEEIPDDWYDGWKEFHRPIVVGDVLIGEGRIVDLYEKESKGRTMTFLVTETVWRDEKSGESAVTERFNLIHRS